MSMMKDMAYVMVGGLIASTLLAMFLMPAFYLLIRRENLDGTKRAAAKAAARTCGGRKHPVLTAPNRDKTGAPRRGSCLVFPTVDSLPFSEGESSGEIHV